MLRLGLLRLRLQKLLLLRLRLRLLCLLVLVLRRWPLLVVAMALDLLVTRAAAGVALAVATPHLPRGETRLGKEGTTERR